jgi:hypothetical protein
MKFAQLAAISAVALVLTACASSAVLVGKTRPPISPDSVKLYVDAPKRFEKVALLEASSKASFSISSQGKMDVVIQRLKEEAAKLGANGILIQGTGEQFGGAVAPTTIYPGAAGGPMFAVGLSAPIMHKAGSGLALFVEEE